MTALISCFVRYYHYENSKYRIFSDSIAGKILSDVEKENIKANMLNGIKFFNPDFKGTDEEALRWIVDNQLAPSVLGRSVFCEKALLNATKIGAKQYLAFASGYDTYAYRNNITDLKVFEIDKSSMIEDKVKRLNSSKIDYSGVNFIKCDFQNKNWIQNITNSNYDEKQISFCSLLGICYYLTKEEFSNMIQNISNILVDGSSIIFDYPTYKDDSQTKKIAELAKEANEEMKAKYLYKEIENILSENDFLIYEHLNDLEMTNNYFENYNVLNPNNKITAPKGVAYCLAVKKVL